jgi:hypothetical protein
MQLSNYSRPDEYTVFLSSGDDATLLRDLVEGLVRDAIIPELHDAGIPVRLMVDRWEHESATRVNPGESVNDIFVRQAVKSSVTLCLLIGELRQGTREEIEAVLDTEGVDLAVIWFVEGGTWPAGEVGTFLCEHKDELFIVRPGPPNSNDATIGLVRQLLHFVLQGISRRQAEGQGGFRERR